MMEVLLGHCLEARNGIRNTFDLVSFSKFGTYSAHAYKIEEGPKTFAFFNWHKTASPAPTNPNQLGPGKKKKEELYLLPYLHLMITMTSHPLKRTTFLALDS